MFKRGKINFIIKAKENFAKYLSEKHSFDMSINQEIIYSISTNEKTNIKDSTVDVQSKLFESMRDGKLILALSDSVAEFLYRFKLPHTCVGSVTGCLSLRDDILKTKENIKENAINFLFVDAEDEIKNTNDPNQISEKVQDFMDALELNSKVPVAWIGTGPQSDHIIDMLDPAVRDQRFDHLLS